MLSAAVIHDVAHVPTAHEKCVGEQLTVALPRHGLGAHQCHSFRAGELFHFFQDAREFIGQHEIRVGAEGADLPSCIDRVGGGLAKAAEITVPNIG